MSKRYGKKRAPDCQCTEWSTCRACLDNAPPYYYTPTLPQIASQSDNSRHLDTIAALNRPLNVSCGHEGCSICDSDYWHDICL